MKRPSLSQKSLSQKSQFSCVRLAINGLISLQTALLGTAIIEFIATQPQLPGSRVAQAQVVRNIESAEEAVVYVETESGNGSGVMIDKDGLIVTNAHVIEGAQQVHVTIQGHRMPAEVVSVGHKNCLDLALLKVKKRPSFRAITLADPDSIYKTQPVYAIGYPGAASRFSATITQGIISNIYLARGRIQLDSSLNPGNSGGAVINDDAKLVGIATSGVGNDINFAVSVDKLQAFITAYRQEGASFTGIRVMPSTESDSPTSAINIKGQEVRGVLQAGDHHYCRDGSLADLYTFEAEAGENIFLKMHSLVMGSFLELVGPDGNRVASDYKERDKAAWVMTSLPKTGTYTIIANAAEVGQSGPYQLVATQPLLIENGQLQGNTVTCTDSGHQCQQYRFLGKAGQAITLLHQAEFDAYRVLRDPTGEIISDSVVSSEEPTHLTLQKDGWHTLLISNQNPGSSGSFTVHVHDTQALSRY